MMECAELCGVLLQIVEGSAERACVWYGVQCGVMQCSTALFVLREGKRLSSEIFPSPNGTMSENFELY